MTKDYRIDWYYNDKALCRDAGVRFNGTLTESARNRIEGLRACPSKGRNSGVGVEDTHKKDKTKRR